MRRCLKVLVGTGLLALLIGVPLLLSQHREPQVQARLVGLAEAGPGDPAAGYLRVTGSADLAFPGDHGPHPDYQTEWWY